MRLAVTEMGRPRGDVPTVLFIHGLFGQSRNWGMVQKHFAPHFHTLAFDLRNQGSSPHATPMTYAAMAEDVAETLAATADLPARVVGHSMGGKTAMTLALRHPALVERLVVADIAPLAYPARQRAVIEALRTVPLTHGLTRKEADAALAATLPEAALRGFLLQNLQFDGATPQWRVPLDLLDEAMPGIEGWQAAEGAHYDGPTLFLRAEHSDYVPPEAAAPIRQLFPASEMITVPNCGHWLHAENPKGFLAALEPFLTA